MNTELSVIIEQDQEWFIAYCPEFPGANGQGKTKQEAITNLKEGIFLLLKDRKEDALKGLPSDAICETLTLV
jgi:predicted RNase H-like HicB family nuclease